MSKVKIEGNASGTGTLTISAPNTNTDRSLTLPDGAGEILLSDGDGSNLTGISSGAWNVVASGSHSGQTLEFTNLDGNYRLLLDVTSTSGSSNFAAYVSNDNGSTWASSYTRIYESMDDGSNAHNTYRNTGITSISLSAPHGILEFDLKHFNESDRGEYFTYSGGYNVSSSFQWFRMYCKSSLTSGVNAFKIVQSTESFTANYQLLQLNS